MYLRYRAKRPISINLVGFRGKFLRSHHFAINNARKASIGLYLKHLERISERSKFYEKLRVVKFMYVVFYHTAVHDSNM